MGVYVLPLIGCLVYSGIIFIDWLFNAHRDIFCIYYVYILCMYIMCIYYVYILCIYIMNIYYVYVLCIYIMYIK